MSETHKYQGDYKKQRLEETKPKNIAKPVAPLSLTKNIAKPVASVSLVEQIKNQKEKQKETAAAPLKEKKSKKRKADKEDGKTPISESAEVEKGNEECKAESADPFQAAFISILKKNEKLKLEKVLRKMKKKDQNVTMELLQDRLLDSQCELVDGKVVIII